ncbi:Cation channel sperm-associated protein 3 [Acipenser ruthenus]|uniref:Cation channel sperm-associated protein 3 n=1 Tax=Acipenser ruthenus TaxID=7906 RepID=A0A444UX26_ACIRT|nr:Cation channel sperm-associated protein 3 [Acipenser ruthenus]
MGYYFFGDPETGDPDNWGDLGSALFTLFSLVTIVDQLFQAIYTMEFLMKVYVEWRGYWKSGYNVFDAFILALSFIPMFMNTSGASTRSLKSLRMIRAVRTLRMLKTVSFIRGLQVIHSSIE